MNKEVLSKKFAVLGSPISHSKSPLIHAAAYRVLSEDWEYSRFEVAKGGLKRFVENEGSGFSGFSLTMPLKEDAFAFADVTDDVSKITKASNTLMRVNDEWRAYNTDVFGITQAIGQASAAPIELSLIIGSGATATSAMLAIAGLAPGSAVLVLARNKSTRLPLIEFGRSLGLQVSVARRLGSAAKKAQVTVSTLPGGAMDVTAKKLQASRFFKPSGLLLDVAYHPWPSQLASAWQSKNQKVVSGLEMLIWQAIAQIRIFKTGNPEIELPNEIAVVQTMRIALEE
jgi:shikimate dehydrogenase